MENVLIMHEDEQDVALSPPTAGKVRDKHCHKL